MNNPLVSIIIPTYNRADLIGETLNSVIAQTYTNWECIVVDDGSTDTTDEVLAEYCKKDNRILYHHRPKNRLKGGSAARNYGFELSKGDYIQWFDDDDIMLSNYLKYRMDALEYDTKLSIISGKIVDANTSIIRVLKYDDTNSLYKQYVLKLTEILPPSVLFKKQFLEEKQLFNESLVRSQEAELFSRLFFGVEKGSFKQIKNIGFLYRQHNQTKSFKDLKYISDYKKAHFIVHCTNWKQALLIDDKEIVNFCYKKIIIILFDVVRNNDISLFNKIMKFLKRKVNIPLYFKIKMSFNLIKLTKIQGYKIKTYLLDQTIVNKKLNF